MRGTMQARLAASAKLSLTVASKTVPPPIAALGGKGGAMLHSEALWSFTSSRFSLLTHIRSKRPEYYLAAQAYSRLRGLHCSAPLNIRCEDCFANNKCAR